MGASIQQLPAETIIDIFDEIEETKQLAQCRLVSKSWASLAEKSMCKTLRLVYFWNDSRLERLNQHLKQKPEYYQLVYNISITDRHWNTFNTFNTLDERLFREFLHLAMTPNIRTLDGIWQ